jgi:hypothetical protein
VFGGVEIVGVVKEKQQAKEEYQRGLREGRQVAYAEVSEKSRDIVNMRIGNVKGNEKVEIRITLLQMLDVSLNTFWQLRLPGTISPRYLN